jgi:FkbM family methyltransferase
VGRTLSTCPCLSSNPERGSGRSSTYHASFPTVRTTPRPAKRAIPVDPNGRHRTPRPPGARFHYVHEHEYPRAGIHQRPAVAHSIGDFVVANRLRAAIDRITLLRSVIKSQPVQHLIQTARGARVVREPLRFVALQMGAPRTACYHLRASGLKVFLRHGTRDVHILNEIFGGTDAHQSYEPPLAIAAVLDANPSPKVLDLGANVGLFGLYVLSRWPHATIRSFEPDPANAAVLRRVIAANELEERWSMAEVAVSNKVDELTFEVGLYSESRLVAESERTSPAEGSSADDIGKTISVRTVDIFAEDHDVDLMKMDIEGGEWAILPDPRLKDLRADVLVLEWHGRGCPEPDARTATIRLLHEAGYSGLEEIESGVGNGLLWAWH